MPRPCLPVSLWSGDSPVRLLQTPQDLMGAPGSNESVARPGKPREG